MPCMIRMHHVHAINGINHVDNDGTMGDDHGTLGLGHMAGFLAFTMRRLCYDGRHRGQG